MSHKTQPLKLVLEELITCDRNRNPTIWVDEMERAMGKLIGLGYGEQKIGYHFQNRSKQQIMDAREDFYN